MGDNEYFRRRAAEELAAAGWATCPKAKRAHRDLAKRYLRKIENGPAAREAPAPAAEGRLSA